MHRNTWKAGERRVAKLLGSKRNALSGRNSGVTASDTRHDRLFVECKHSKAHAVWTLYDKTKALAQAEQKTPVIALSRLRSTGVIFCIHQSDIHTFYQEWCQTNPPVSPPEKPRKRKRKVKPV